MALRIVRASDPISVNQLVACVSAPPGIGKSSLGFAAQSLLLDFDHGAYRAANRKDSVQVDSWSDIAGITAADLAGYKTVVLDTAGRALDLLSLDIIAQNPKHGNGGALSLQGYGVLKSRFIAYLNLIRSFGLDVLLLAHMDEQRRGDDVIERIDIQGGSKNEIYKSADVMGRLSLRGGKRYLNFSPTDFAFGKNPAQLPELEVPNFAAEPDWFVGVLADIKGRINEQNARQTEATNALKEWQAKFAQAETPAELTAFVALTVEGDKNVKRLLLDVGKKRGWTFDAATKAFVAAKPAENSAAPKQEALV